MHNNLSLTFHIQEELDSIGYPDSHRVSFEISDFLSNNPDMSLEDVLIRLKKDEPWEYIRGWAEFCGNRFTVTPDVLIPRIETEQLVEDAYSYISTNNIHNIVDVGTGSGCIAITLAKRLPHSSINNIFATDISAQALEVAIQNEKNILNRNTIHWINTDLITKLPGLDGSTLFVANLPYIPTEQYLHLDRSVKEYEPRLALDGGTDGLVLFRKLFEQIKEKDMVTEGIFIETEESVFNQTIELLNAYFPLVEIKQKSDLYGRDRFVYAYFKS